MDSVFPADRMPDDLESSKSDATDALDRWLDQLVSGSGSDLILVPGAPACGIIDGALCPLGKATLDGRTIEAAVTPALSEHALQMYREIGIADSSYSRGKVGRFRVNIHREKGNTAAAIRALPSKIPSFDSLHLPPSVLGLASLPRGLVLIGGPAGSGKSTTLAALVNEMNSHHSRHIVIIEGPIEYQHVHNRCIIEQVEIGTDAPDFPTALRASLRQAPDVIVVGEMRDPETMRIAVAAAETGHLVLSTIHTTDVATTVGRIADSFPAERQNTIRQELAMCLSAVLTQILLRGKQGGRYPAAELLMVGYGARQHIRRNALQYLHQEIALTKKKGSFPLEESLVQLIKLGHITREDAAICALHPDDLEIMLKS